MIEVKNPRVRMDVRELVEEIKAERKKEARMADALKTQRGCLRLLLNRLASKVKEEK